MPKDTLIKNKKNLLKQKPRLLYAGLSNNASDSCRETHTHEFCEILLIGKGFGEATISGRSYPIKKGDLMIYNKGVPHSENLIPTSTEDTEVMFVAFDNLHVPGLEEDCLLKNDGAVIPTESYFEPLRFYFKELIKELESEQPFHENVSNALGNVLLIQLLRIASFDYELTFGRNNAYLEAKDYFDKHYTKIESLDAVCKNLYINKYYLSHLFKQQIGVPPVKYLINKRIALAKHLLETTDLSVGEIATQCGYTDIGYFCRVFKNCENMTPLQHRYTYKREQLEKSFRDEQTPTDQTQTDQNETDQNETDQSETNQDETDQSDDE